MSRDVTQLATMTCRNQLERASVDPEGQQALYDGPDAFSAARPA